MSDPMPNEVASVGGKTGARVAKLIADAVIYSRQRMGPHAKAVAISALGDFTDLMSDESKQAIGPLLAKLGKSADLSPEARSLLDFMTLKRGQWQALAAGSATGAAFGGGLINLISNELNPAITRLIAGNPNNILDPSDAARAEARGIPGPPTWNVEANRNGIDDNRFAALVELNRALPAAAEILDMVNRGTIGENVARNYLRRNGYSADASSHLLALRRFIPSPADLSAMWNRSIVSTDEGARLAAMSGVSAEDWKRLIELGGEPLAPEALGEAFRRGFIDAERYQRGIVQGPIRNEWFDVLSKLQFHRMSVIDAADAVNQGHMDAAEGKRIAHETGLEPRDFETLLETAGAPPGIDFATEALNRGFITEQQFMAMFFESRIKNKYAPLLIDMAKRLIPAETVRLLFRNGVYSREKTLRTLTAHGFTLDDATAMLALEETRQDDGTKELTRAQIVDMYEQRMLTLDAAIEALTGIGYSAEDAQSMIELADLKRLLRFVNAVVSKVRASYVAGRIDASTASAALDRLGLPTAQRDDLLDLWDIERTTVSKTLTGAQIRQALKKGLIDEADALSRLTAQGYDDVDAGIYLQLTS